MVSVPAVGHDVPAVADPIEQTQAVVRRSADMGAGRFIGP